MTPIRMSPRLRQRLLGPRLGRPALAAVVLAGAMAPVDAAAGATSRVSVASGGGEGNGPSFAAVTTADGRYVAFASSATNLVAGDTNGAPDVFVHDRASGATVRVSVDSTGAEANGASTDPAISADGRYVAFASTALTLAAGDLNQASDVFVHDRDGDEDGVFDEPGAVATTLVSGDAAGIPGNGASTDPTVSDDGAAVGFTSAATNLVGLVVDTNAVTDVFVRDRASGATERVSVDSAGAEADRASLAPALSGDGRYIAFGSAATNLVAGDTNGASDIFVHDRASGATERVSVGSDGAQAAGDSAGAAVSRDGRYVAFSSRAANLVAGDTNGASDIFVHDRASAATTRASADSDGVQANSDSFSPALSADGRYVAFDSRATNLVGDDTNAAFDVFVHNNATATTMRASVASDGAQATGGNSTTAALSADVGAVVFHSSATNLVAGDANATLDVFAHEGLDPPPLTCAGRLPTIVGTQANDLIAGTNRADVIHARGGHDTIEGLKGDDVICGGDGNDTINAGAGNDTVDGGGGDDTVRGEAGTDALDGGDGSDACDGGGGRGDTAVNCEQISGVP